MLLHPRHNPPGWYRRLYYGLCLVLGAVLALGAQTVVRLVIAQAGGDSHVPWAFQGVLWLAGLVGGAIVGPLWWRWVYVDRRWEK